MAWKRLTRGGRKWPCFVNLDNVLYMNLAKGEDEQILTRLVFAPHAYEESKLEVLVDQTPEEILGDEIS